MPDSCPSHLDPTCTGQSNAEPVKLSVVQNYFSSSLLPSLSLCSTYVKLGCASSARTPRLSPSLPRLSPSLSPPLLALSGCPISLAWPLFSFHHPFAMARCFPASLLPGPSHYLLDSLDITPLTSSHSHHGLWAPGTHSAKISILITQAPSLPLQKLQATSCPGNSDSSDSLLGS